MDPRLRGLTYPHKFAKNNCSKFSVMI